MKQTFQIYSKSEKNIKKNFCNCFLFIKRLINKGSVNNWVSDAINIISKKIDIHMQPTKYVWADVDNLNDLRSAKKIVKMAELK